MKEFRPHSECRESTCYFHKYCVDAESLLRDIAPENLPLLTFDWVGILEGRMEARKCKHQDAKEARKRVQAVIDSIPKPQNSSD